MAKKEFPGIYGTVESQQSDVNDGEVVPVSGYQYTAAE